VLEETEREVKEGNRRKEEEHGFPKWAGFIRSSRKSVF
jgi:hypothetical protein